MNPEPIATYRLQLRPGFGLAEAAALVPYLAELGVSHLYTSPYLQATAGSEHGYDVVDPGRVNQELGGAEAQAELCAVLQAAGLGHMIDLVPNHMAIAGRQNPWWWDVLENGPASAYATYFDVDWEASEERWPNKVLLPVLGDHYGRVLEGGELQLVHTEGTFVLQYHEHVFPLDPSSLAALLGRAADAASSELLAFLAASHARLPRPTVTARQAVERRHRDRAVLATLLVRICREEPAATAAIDAEVARLGGDPDALDALIDQQNYRLARWRAASRDLGYRRFFDINGLMGLRVEDLEVFRATHALPITWVAEGRVQGLRIDHPDGLKDPGEYFRRLRASCPQAWIVAEKILEGDEQLPADWPVAGTTGYDYLNLVGGLFVDPDGEQALTRTYAAFTGEDVVYEELVRDCKRLVLRDLLGSDLNRLRSLFVDICERHRRHRDHTRHELREALFATAVWFPVYRSYVSVVSTNGGGVSPADERHVADAIAGAASERTDLDPELFAFLADLLLLRVPGELEAELALRFQQLTGPAMAKGVEDTAFYRYHRLIALNEVGGDPSRFAVSVARYHEVCTTAQAARPRSLLAATTHDTKRSEDVRARLALLAEIPQQWDDAVRRWSAHNEWHRRDDWPDRNTEYLVYQTLVGAWPLTVERLGGYLQKAVREAKQHTSWTRPDETYETAVDRFAAAIMADQEFRRDLEAFVAVLTQPGRINGLAQTLLRLTAPGVADIYQGTELWDLSLVDPDNRRPVDFAHRRRLLAECRELSPVAIMARMDEGLPKLHLLREALHLRRRRPDCFGPDGAYRPLHARGERSQHIVAALRGDDVAAVVPRLVLRWDGSWAGTLLDLPPGRWRNALTGEDLAGGEVQVAGLLAQFPVALLERAD